MRGAAIYALVIIALGVLPLLLMSGVYGAFFQEIVLPFLIALAVSMMVARPAVVAARRPAPVLHEETGRSLTHS